MRQVTWRECDLARSLIMALGVLLGRSEALQLRLERRRRVVAATEAVSIDELKAIARRVRRHIVTIVAAANSGHPGGSLSAVEIATALYFRVMLHDPQKPLSPERDRLV